MGSKRSSSPVRWDLLDEWLDEEGVDHSEPRITRNKRVGPQALSFSQRRLWFFSQFAKNHSAYNMPLLIEIRGDLQEDALEESLQRLVQRHEVFRTTFQFIDGEPMQIVTDTCAFQLNRSVEPADEEVRKQIETEARRPFDLTQGPLLRAQLWKCEDQKQFLLITIHHIVSDGWSIRLIWQELLEQYEQIRTGVSRRKERTIRYTDYAAWQSQWLLKEKVEEMGRYWERKLAGAPALLKLPTDRSRPPVQGGDGFSQRMYLTRELTRQLHDLAKQEGTTMFMLMLSAWKVLLYRYSGQEDLLVGTPVTGRNKKEVEHVIGLFVNMIVLRTAWGIELSFRELLHRVKENVLESFDYQDFPFEKLVERIRVERDPSYHPLFQVTFSYEDQPLSERKIEGVTFSPQLIENGGAKFDLSLDAVHTPEGMMVTLSYNTELYEKTTMRRMLSQLETVLKNIVTDPDALLSRIQLLSDEDRHLLQQVWSPQSLVDPDEACIHHLIEQQVKKTPDYTALIDGEERLSYRELDRRANQVAHCLIRLGVGPGTFVGIGMDRSSRLIVALLGILKAGGAYVPLDTHHPPDRLQLILEDANLSVIVTEARWQGIIGSREIDLLCMDTDGAVIDQQPITPVESQVASLHASYMIYTSGSTGRPKGVIIEHHNTVNLLKWFKQEFRADDLKGVLAASSICFDISVYELFLPLIVGGKVILAQSVLHFPDLPAKDEVTVVFTLPSVMTELMRTGDLPPSVRLIKLGAEPLRKDLVDQLYEIPSVTKVYNFYGPTETTTLVTYAALDKGSKEEPTIGRPIGNTFAYVVDSHLQPVPIGVPGELCIGGAAVGRGYHRLPQLTDVRFVPDPFSPDFKARMYRTGDLVRYRPDGRLDFLGRIDSQVKVRGFRLEPGEIEAVLEAHHTVRQAIILVKESLSGKRLVAFVVADEQVTGQELKHYLKKKLPDYMIPDSLVFLGKLPLLPNGKYDRKALLQIEEPDRVFTKGEPIPRNAIEQEISEIWKQALHMERIDLHENFFELGGHSLLFMRIHAQIKEQINSQVTILDLFRYPTIASLSAFLMGSERDVLSLQETKKRADKQRSALKRRRRGIEQRGIDSE